MDAQTNRATPSARWLLALTTAFSLSACGWADADRGRNTDHDPPPGEETWDPDLEDAIDTGPPPGDPDA